MSNEYQFPMSANYYWPHEQARRGEMALIGAEVALSASRMFGFRPQKTNPHAALLAKCRGMVRKDESPWVTFRHLIRAGKVNLIRRPNKPPLLVAIAIPKRASA